MFVCAALACGPAVAESYGPVARAETLWAVAKKLAAQQGSGTTAQMAWALYQNNPEAFEGSPSRMRAGATLLVPDAAAVRATPTKEAYALVTGAPARPAGAAAPVIEQAALQPPIEGDPHQWLVVSGRGFAPGAVLEFRDLTGGRTPPPGKPQSVREGRIEYAAAFPEAPGRWQAVVRNADGRRSAPVEFAVGGVVAQAAGAAPGTPGGRFDGSADQQALLDLVRAGAPAEARHRLLAGMEDQYAGDVDFDYPFGTLALDTGRFSEAVFILQRAVARRPAFSGARMELARAYYALGDNESARREFTRLQREDPPPEARRLIAQYLAAIDQRAVGYAPQRGVYAELASGYDSNANGAPDIQNFIGFTLDSRNQSTDSAYYALAVGGSLSHPLAPAWRTVASGQASYRANPDASFVDSQALRLGGGIEWRPGRWVVSLVPSGAYVMLDGEANHQVLAADGAAAFGENGEQLALVLRYAQQRYDDVLSVQDVDTVLYGLGSQQRVPGLPWLRLDAAATAGTEEAVEAGSPFGRDLLGLRAGLLVDLGGAGALSLSLASLESDYDGTFFGTPRTDEQVGATLSFHAGWWRESGWALRAQLAWVDNTSTVALYDYDRIDVGLGLRKEFK
jgi:outer membrane protein